MSRNEWSIKILKCDIDFQEFGVISNPDVKRIRIADGGLKDTMQCGMYWMYLYGHLFLCRWYVSTRM